jgi:spore coat protein CotF
MVNLKYGEKNKCLFIGYHITRGDIWCFLLKKQEEYEQGISVAEVYNLWDVLNNCYETFEQLNIYRLYAHDLDLKLLIANNISEISNRSQEVEKIMEQFKIKTPDRPRKDVHAAINSQVISDDQIAKQLLLIAQENVEMKVRGVINSKMNDTLRKFFMKLVKEDIDNIDDIIKYTKIKGWIQQPPLLQNLPEDCKEKIDVGEAFHLYEHLVFRYLNIEQTMFFIKFAHDGDFRFLLKKVMSY